MTAADVVEKLDRWMHKLRRMKAATYEDSTAEDIAALIGEMRDFNVEAMRQRGKDDESQTHPRV